MTIQDPLSILIYKERRKDLASALSKILPFLTKTQADIIILLADGFSYADTAKILHISRSNIYQYIDAIPVRLNRLHVDLTELYFLLHE